MIEIDLRVLPPFERHTKIFEAWAKLAVGDKIKLINDHSPKPLYYQFDVEEKDKFDWKYLEEGPTDWIFEITRIKK